MKSHQSSVRYHFAQRANRLHVSSRSACFRPRARRGSSWPPPTISASHEGCDGNRTNSATRESRQSLTGRLRGASKRRRPLVENPDRFEAGARGYLSICRTAAPLRGWCAFRKHRRWKWRRSDATASSAPAPRSAAGYHRRQRWWCCRVRPRCSTLPIFRRPRAEASLFV